MDVEQRVNPILTLLQDESIPEDILNLDLVDSQDYALKITNYILQSVEGFEFSFPNLNNTAFEKLIEQSKDNFTIENTLISWLTGFFPNYRFLSQYSIFLYNINWRETRYCMRRFLEQDLQFPPPYLSLLLLNIFKRLNFENLDQIPDDVQVMAQSCMRLFSDSKAVDHFLTHLNMPIRNLSGKTNTVLGLYDHFFHEELLWKNSDRFIDLGGGYNTPEVERLTGNKFTSFDILNPIPHDNFLLLEKNKETIKIANPQTTQNYIKRLEKVEHQKFDVTCDKFAQDVNRYTIVSTGFLNSTVKVQTGVVGQDRMRKNAKLTCLLGILKVIELVQAGKDVELFCVGRSTTRAMKFNCVHIRWQNRKIKFLETKLTGNTVLEKFSDNLKNKIRESIDPANPHFNSLVRKFESAM